MASGGDITGRLGKKGRAAQASAVLLSEPVVE